MIEWNISFQITNKVVLLMLFFSPILIHQLEKINKQKKFDPSEYNNLEKKKNDWNGMDWPNGELVVKILASNNKLLAQSSRD